MSDEAKRRDWTADIVPVGQKTNRLSNDEAARSLADLEPRALTIIQLDRFLW
jgi:hypothetical protein